ncbi:hypothetical protein P154DRAFT_572039 [Amniculicola lignicola CBS 123094]|uniref:Uncharacterized protein n=1 Tax=Amniculicola lignicola CBS 123094 TaxID=1392246 RepID=A0A6A5WUI2_9PLEO|nr:hypothetical protein P154DRAFT_572039 [Amniculicola lignicola CBS 123094]
MDNLAGNAEKHDASSIKTACGLGCEHQSRVVESTHHNDFAPLNRPKPAGKTCEDCSDPATEIGDEEDTIFEIVETVYTWSQGRGYRTGAFRELPAKADYTSPTKSVRKAKDRPGSKPVVPPQVKRATFLLADIVESGGAINTNDGANDGLDTADNDDQGDNNGLYSPRSEEYSDYAEDKLPRKSKSKKDTTRSAHPETPRKVPTFSKIEPKRKISSSKATSVTPKSKSKSKGIAPPPTPMDEAGGSMAASVSKRKAIDNGANTTPSKSSKTSHKKSQNALEGSFNAGVQSGPPPAFSLEKYLNPPGFDNSAVGNDGQWRFMDTGIGSSDSKQNSYYSSGSRKRANSGFGAPNNGVGNSSSGEDPFVDQGTSPETVNVKKEPVDDDGWSDEEDSVDGDRDDDEDEEIKSYSGNESDFSILSKKKYSGSAVVGGRKRKARAPRAPLKKWDQNDWKMGLLGMISECGMDGTKINFSKSARWIGPSVTGSAFQQAVLKLRDKMIKDGIVKKENMPPIRMAWTKNKKEDALMKECKTANPLNAILPRPSVPMADAGVQVMMIRLNTSHSEEHHRPWEIQRPVRQQDQRAEENNARLPESEEQELVLTDTDSSDIEESDEESDEEIEADSPVAARSYSVYQSTTGLWQPGDQPLVLTQPFTPPESSADQNLNAHPPELTDNQNPNDYRPEIMDNSNQWYNQTAFASQDSHSYVDDDEMAPYDNEPSMFTEAGFTDFTNHHNYAASLYGQDANTTALSSTLSGPEVNNGVVYDSTFHGHEAFGSQYDDRSVGAGYASDTTGSSHGNMRNDFGYNASVLDPFNRQSGAMGPYYRLTSTQYHNAAHGNGSAPTGFSYDEGSHDMGYNTGHGATYADETHRTHFRGEEAQHFWPANNDSATTNQLNRLAYRNQTRNQGSGAFGDDVRAAGVVDPLLGGSSTPNFNRAQGPNIMVTTPSGTHFSASRQPATTRAPEVPDSSVPFHEYMNLDGMNDDPYNASAGPSASGQEIENFVALDEGNADIEREDPRELEARRSAEARLAGQGDLTEAWWQLFPDPEVWASGSRPETSSMTLSGTTVSGGSVSGGIVSGGIVIVSSNVVSGSAGSSSTVPSITVSGRSVPSSTVSRGISSSRTASSGAVSDVTPLTPLSDVTVNSRRSTIAGVYMTDGEAGQKATSVKENNPASCYSV